MDFARRLGYRELALPMGTEWGTCDSINEDTPQERYVRILFREGGCEGQNLMSQYVCNGILLGNLFISGNFPLHPIPHSLHLCSQRTPFLRLLSLSIPRHPPNILHYSLSHLIARFIVLGDIFRGSTSLCRITMHLFLPETARRGSACCKTVKS